MQLALDASVRNHQTSIELRGETRERIATLVSHLKTQVSNLEMEAARKDRLIKRIEAFEKELEERRLSFAAVGGMALVVAAAVANVDGSVDVVRRLTHEIETAVGRAFEEQEREAALLLPREEVRRLEPPRKAEPEPRAYGGGAYGKHNSDFDLDDDIPF